MQWAPAVHYDCDQPDNAEVMTRITFRRGNLKFLPERTVVLASAI